jgi:hypothetical protein
MLSQDIGAITTDSVSLMEELQTSSRAYSSYIEHGKAEYASVFTIKRDSVDIALVDCGVLTNNVDMFAKSMGLAVQQKIASELDLISTFVDASLCPYEILSNPQLITDKNLQKALFDNPKRGELNQLFPKLSAAIRPIQTALTKHVDVNTLLSASLERALTSKRNARVCLFMDYAVDSLRKVSKASSPDEIAGIAIAIEAKMEKKGVSWTEFPPYMGTLFTAMKTNVVPVERVADEQLIED